MARSFPTKHGYTLQGYPECTQLHRGQHQGKSVYIVGRNTDDERLFKRSDLAEASTHSKTVRQQVESIATADLCDQAVIDLYG